MRAGLAALFVLASGCSLILGDFGESAPGDASPVPDASPGDGGACVSSGVAGVRPFFRSIASKTQNDETKNSITVPVPVLANPGDLLLASLIVAHNGGDAPTVMTPAGWTQIGLVKNNGSYASATFWTVTGSTEQLEQVFVADIGFKGLAVISRFGGVRCDQPVERVQGVTSIEATLKFSTPGFQITNSNDLLVATFAGNSATAGMSTWSLEDPASWMFQNTLVQSGRSYLIAYGPPVTPPQAGPVVASASLLQDEVFLHLIALSPPP